MALFTVHSFVCAMRANVTKRSLHQIKSRKRLVDCWYANGLIVCIRVSLQVPSLEEIPFHFECYVLYSANNVDIGNFTFINYQTIFTKKFTLDKLPHTLQLTLLFFCQIFSAGSTLPGMLRVDFSN